MNRRLTLSLAGAGAYYATLGISFPLLLLQAEALGGPRAAGLVLGLPMLAYTVASSGWGWLSDRWESRKRVVMLSIVAVAVLYLPQPWLGAWGLVAVRVVQAVFQGGMVHLNTLFAELDPRARGLHLGRLQAVSGLAWGFGGLLAGFLVAGDAYGRASPPVIAAFMVSAALGVAAMAGLMELPERRGRAVTTPPAPLRGLWPLWVATILLFTGYYIFLTFAPAYLSELLGSTRNMGWVLAASGVASALLAPWLGRLCDRLPRVTTLRLVFVLYFILMLVYTAQPHPLLVAAAFVPPIWILFQVSATALVADRVPYALRGRAIGLLNSSLFLGGGLGGIAAGVLRERMELQPLFAIGTVLVAAGALVGWRLPRGGPLSGVEGVD